MNKNNIFLKTKQKLQILSYATITPDGQAALLKQVYKCASKKILNYLHTNKIKTCYVHFTFIDSTINPVIIIDQDPSSNKEMFCVKYTKYIDY